MCPYCLAGSLRCSFEEIDQDPSWTETLFESRPWDAAPVLTTVPFDQERPEFVFKLDLFHVMKVGLSRHVVGSLIIILSKLGYFDLDPHGAESHDINDRLSRAHGLFKLWCAGVGKSPGLRSFTRTFMNCKTFSCAPWANSKGSDTTLLVAWLTFFISLTLQGLTQDHGDRFFLSVAKTVLENIKGMHQVCESHGLWLDRSCGQNLYARMILVAKGYNVLAKQGIDLGIVSFSMIPKYHALKHVAFQIRSQLRRGCPRILNPQIDCCESNEDHVGKVAALSRRVSTRLLTRRVIQRYFLKTRALIVRHVKSHGAGFR
ncbi:unnamed protein product [Durusdinium trenchii]|uniref:Uncharacterized protein n=3 Tax=Durusdinium trenchii TaxID=1381693 RepID=A0ABP0PRR7_9DINO